MYTIGQLDKLWRASVDREEKLINAYWEKHRIPSRGQAWTPEIQAERDEQQRIFQEYTKIKRSMNAEK